ncbi:hypothetical protein WJX74_005622 [Apatococcus lobatus]|uniref:TFIIS N-terminal domain-containing protein n=1 Tax=Apatococcus lobatus TaxID=904363 RepID=A0AAW1QMV3_9CHLO
MADDTESSKDQEATARLSRGTRKRAAQDTNKLVASPAKTRNRTRQKDEDELSIKSLAERDDSKTGKGLRCLFTARGKGRPGKAQQTKAPSHANGTPRHPPARRKQPPRTTSASQQSQPDSSPSMASDDRDQPDIHASSPQPPRKRLRRMQDNPASDDISAQPGQDMQARDQIPGLGPTPAKPICETPSANPDIASHATQLPSADVAQPGSQQDDVKVEAETHQPHGQSSSQQQQQQHATHTGMYPAQHNPAASVAEVKGDGTEGHAAGEDQTAGPVHSRLHSGQQAHGSRPATEPQSQLADRGKQVQARPGKSSQPKASSRPDPGHQSGPPQDAKSQGSPPHNIWAERRSRIEDRSSKARHLRQQLQEVTKQLGDDLQELSQADMTVKILQDSQLGRVVMPLSKGKVVEDSKLAGDAKALISKWKSLLGDTPAPKQPPQASGAKQAAAAAGTRPAAAPRAQSGGNKPSQSDAASAGPGRRPSTGVPHGPGPSSSGPGMAMANGKPMHPPGTAGRGRPPSGTGPSQDAPGPQKVAPFGSAAAAAKPKANVGNIGAASKDAAAAANAVAAAETAPASGPTSTGNTDRDKCIQLLAEALQPALRPEAIAQQLEAALLKCCAPGGVPSLRYKQRLRSLWPILQQQSDTPASPVRQALLQGEMSCMRLVRASAEDLKQLEASLVQAGATQPGRPGTSHQPAIDFAPNQNLSNGHALPQSPYAASGMELPPGLSSGVSSEQPMHSLSAPGYKLQAGHGQANAGLPQLQQGRHAADEAAARTASGGSQGGPQQGKMTKADSTPWKELMGHISSGNTPDDLPAHHPLSLSPRFSAHPMAALHPVDGEVPGCSALAVSCPLASSSASQRGLSAPTLGRGQQGDHHSPCAPPPPPASQAIPGLGSAHQPASTMAPGQLGQATVGVALEPPAGQAGLQQETSPAQPGSIKEAVGSDFLQPPQGDPSGSGQDVEMMSADDRPPESQPPAQAFTQLFSAGPQQQAVPSLPSVKASADVATAAAPAAAADDAPAQLDLPAAPAEAAANHCESVPQHMPAAAALRSASAPLDTVAEAMTSAAAPKISSPSGSVEAGALQKPKANVSENSGPGSVNPGLASDPVVPMDMAMMGGNGISGPHAPTPSIPGLAAPAGQQLQQSAQQGQLQEQPQLMTSHALPSSTLQTTGANIPSAHPLSLHRLSTNTLPAVPNGPLAQHSLWNTLKQQVSLAGTGAGAERPKSEPVKSQPSAMQPTPLPAVQPPAGATPSAGSSRLPSVCDAPLNGSRTASAPGIPSLNIHQDAAAANAQPASAPSNVPSLSPHQLAATLQSSAASSLPPPSLHQSAAVQSGGPSSPAAVHPSPSQGATVPLASLPPSHAALPESVTGHSGATSLQHTHPPMASGPPLSSSGPHSSSCHNLQGPLEVADLPGTPVRIEVAIAIQFSSQLGQSLV